MQELQKTKQGKKTNCYVGSFGTILVCTTGENILKTGFIFVRICIFFVFVFVFAFLLVFVFVVHARWDKFEGWLLP